MHTTDATYKVIVEPGTVVTDRSFQTASWWRTLELTPGEYEFERHSNTSMWWATIPGIIIEDYFASNFAGASYQPYDKLKNKGQPANYGIMRYDYQLKEEPEVMLSWKDS
jgi:hypothetical protein